MCLDFVFFFCSCNPVLFCVHSFFVFFCRTSCDYCQENGRPKVPRRGPHFVRVRTVETQRRCKMAKGQFVAPFYSFWFLFLERAIHSDVSFNKFLLSFRLRHIFQDGTEVKPSKELRIYAMGRKRFLQLMRCRVEDSGSYTCDAGDAATSCNVEVFGKNTQTNKQTKEQPSRTSQCVW